MPYTPSFAGRCTWAGLVGLSAACAQAQTAAEPAATASQQIVVTAPGSGEPDAAKPAVSLSGDALLQRRGNSLADTLDGQPGVSAAPFGPQANRPQLRGHDGERVRVLGNDEASVDVSGLSADHAVPIDPLAVERIEVLRGPAALPYAGGVAGGVVNVVDNRIPTAAIGSALSGSVEARAGGAANERAAAALLEGGTAGVAWHADAFRRLSDDLRVPSFERPLPGGGSERRDRVANTSGQADGGALGVSLLGSQGYLGASVDTYRNRYGTPVEEDVRLNMKRDHVALAGEWRPRASPWSALRLHAGHTEYRHDEIEGTGEIGTTFQRHGSELRLDATQRPRTLAGGQWQGSAGVQADDTRLQALGEEAYLPSTHSRNAALYALQNWRAGALQLDAGLRVERTRLSSAGDDPAAATVRFGSAQVREFTPGTLSLGGSWRVGPWQWSGHWTGGERAPAPQELWANGLHIASGAYERGDPAQRAERGQHLEAALGWQGEAWHWQGSVYTQRFANYIALRRTGEPDVLSDAGVPFPVYAYQGVRARLSGLELQGHWHGPQGWAGDVQLQGLRGDDLSHGEPLARLAPWRATLALERTLGAWSARGEVQHAGAQSRVPADDSRTPGWTLVNLSASYRLRVRSDDDLLLFLRINNLTDRLAYSATTMASARWLAPLPGRGVSAGLRWSY